MPAKKTTSKKTAKKMEKKYSDEFITKALATWDKMRNEGRTSEDAAKAIGVHNSMLYYWKSRKEGRQWGRKTPALPKARKPPAQRRAPQQAAADESLIVDLKREIAALTEERDVLKKAVMVFARR